MAEVSTVKPARRIRHRGRISQIRIYLGKQLRFFINESDWKVLPMAAVIAGLVGLVIRRRFFVNMEGSLIGAFALTCTAIWNGCFNSIQAVCRERPIIKREHRSGMHVTSYVAAHMIYQFFLCAAQTALSMYVLRLMEVPFPGKGLITDWMIVDIGLTMLLISYASDMLSLFISSISHTTTGAMTVMPFILIFQLVFSGGIIPLPAWSQSLSAMTISNYGIKAIAAQSGYNDLPMATAWNTLSGMRNDEVGGTFTLGQVLDLMNSPAVEKKRDSVVLREYTAGEVLGILSGAAEETQLRGRELLPPVTVREAVELLRFSDAFRDERALALWTAPDGSSVTLGMLLDTLAGSEDMEALLDREISGAVTVGQALDSLSGQVTADGADRIVSRPVTLGEIVDTLKNNQALQQMREKTFELRFTVGDLLDVFGEKNVKEAVQQKTAAASRKTEYAGTMQNIAGYWTMLMIFILGFALLATLALELIDRDKR